MVAYWLPFGRLRIFRLSTLWKWRDILEGISNKKMKFRRVSPLPFYQSRRARFFSRPPRLRRYPVPFLGGKRVSKLIGRRERLMEHPSWCWSAAGVAVVPQRTIYINGFRESQREERGLRGQVLGIASSAVQRLANLTSLWKNPQGSTWLTIYDWRSEACGTNYKWHALKDVNAHAPSSSWMQASCMPIKLLEIATNQYPGEKTAGWKFCKVSLIIVSRQQADLDRTVGTWKPNFW